MAADHKLGYVTVPISKLFDTFVMFCPYLNCTNVARMDSPSSRTLERRRGRRYPARLPVAIKFTTAHMAESCFSARTQNLSENGILLSSNSRIPEGSDVELTIDAAAAPLLLKGKVLRVTSRPGKSFAIAVACEFPLSLFRPWP
ncbi:MAG TPA: PilZ domain-containing protein [Terriglobales bacterium]|nr:PilZ domain-containing protein [Terriglobales bacterium]